MLVFGNGKLTTKGVQESPTNHDINKFGSELNHALII